MPASGSFSIQQLGPSDLGPFRTLLGVFGAAFDEVDTYEGAQPGDAYLRDLLGSAPFIALAAVQDGEVVGGLAAYELRKFERERSEIYIYDLAVLEAHRRRGMATALIARLRQIGAARGAYVLFVQADPPDAAAVALYGKLGQREEVLHFDIPAP